MTGWSGCSLRVIRRLSSAAVASLEVFRAEVFEESFTTLPKSREFAAGEERRTKRSVESACGTGVSCSTDGHLGPKNAIFPANSLFAGNFAED
jgi:hypothetical protein